MKIKKRWFLSFVLICFLMIQMDGRMIYAADEQAIGSAYVQDEYGIMPASSTPGKNCIITYGESITYYSWTTHEYFVTDNEGERHLGYCAQPNKPTPSGTFVISELKEDVLKAAILTGCDGEYLNSIGKNMYGPYLSDRKILYAMTHSVIGYLYDGSLQGVAAVADGVQNIVKTLRENYQKWGIDYSKYRLFVAKNDKQDIVWLEKAPQPKYGNLKIKKTSTLSQISQENRCYTLEGAKYEVYLSGTKTKVGTIVTDSQGEGKLEHILPGSYEIVEVEPPKGFLLDEQKYSCVVEADKTKLCEVSDIPIYDRPQLLLLKQDAETGTPQIDGGLEGAEYELRYYDVIMERDPAAEGEIPREVWRFRTDEEGKILFTPQYQVDGEELLCVDGNYVLPLGTITMQEKKAPEGYLLDDTLYIAHVVYEDGEIKTVNLPNQEGHCAKDQPIRGELSFVKVDGDNKRPMANIPFEIESETTKEKHVLVTDNNGIGSTKAVPHSQNTNKGSSSEDGIWFGEGKVEDNKGALLFGTYQIRELPCKENQGKDLLEFEVTVTQNGEDVLQQVILENKTIQLKTKACDEDTGTQMITEKEKAVILDTISYENLTVGRKYLVKGIVMDADTGEELLVDGEMVTAEKEFVPEETSGNVELSFSFDAGGMRGRTVVIFESLYWKDSLVQEHRDLQDKEQTISFPYMRTHAWDGVTKDHIASIREEAVLMDTVIYQSLIPGLEYRVSGILMDQDTGNPVLLDGAEVTAETVFVPDERNGSVDVQFHLDTRKIANKHVVIFEELYFQDMLLLSHKDLEDDNQKLNFPSIGTTAIDKETKTHEGILAAKAYIQDRVTYKNLIPQKEYQIRGTLIDKKTGEQILTEEGLPIMREVFFTPEDSDGTIEVEFELDSSKVQGKSVVVFETLLYGESEVVIHADLKDENQTVTYPKSQPKKIEKGVKTGDDTLIGWYLLLLVITGILFVFLPKADRRGE